MKKILATTIMIMTSAIFAFGQCSDADTKALEAFDRAWGDADTRATLEPYYADDYRGVGLLGTSTKEQALANITPVDPNFSADHYVIACTANTATITHRYTVKSMENGREKRAYGRAIHFLEKRGGKWKVVSNTGYPLLNESQLVSIDLDNLEAFKNHDVKWFEQNLADDYIGNNTEGKNENKAQVLERVKNHKYKFDSIKLSNVNVRMNGDSATIMGIYTLTGKDEQGKPILDSKLRFSRSLVKKDGNWMVAAEQYYLATDSQ